MTITTDQIFHWMTALVTLATVLDATIPPSDNPVLKSIKAIVSFVAVNFGHSQNMAPSQAIKDQNGGVGQ
jgi:hypothetical protein